VAPTLLPAHTIREMADEWSRAETDDGQRFVFAESGEGAPVVLLHGFPDTPHGWERIAAALADAGYRALAPWLRGYHPETIVEGRPYDLATIGSDPIRFLDALGEREAIIVGHDWGAGMAYAATNLHPDRVRAIVAIAIPHPGAAPRDLPTLWAARHFVGLNMPFAEQRVRRADFAYLEGLYRRWSPDWSGPERDRALAEAKRALADPRSLKGAVDHYRALRSRVSPVLTRPTTTPGHVVAGTHGLDRGVYERSAAMLGEGSQSMIVDGAGHWAHREREDAFIERLLAFVGEVDQADR
jgi:pimeloyl-ACP methyl ester carboxylesterase